MSEPREKSPAAPSAPAKKAKVNPWVDNIEALVVAVVLALIIRVFVVEAFVIPTGSMAGTLYGEHYELKCPNCGFQYALGVTRRPDGSIEEPSPQRVLCINCGFPSPGLPSISGGDRILVNKVLYRFDQPKRWDPFVFVNPTCAKGEDQNKTTYIKRLVGLPGDHLEIFRGDVVVNGQIQRKPPSAQGALWMPVYDSRYVWQQTEPGEAKPWRNLNGSAWRLEGTTLVAEAPKDTLAWVEYSGRIGGRDSNIRDLYGYDPDGAAGFNVVTDLRVRLDASAGASGIAEIALRLDDWRDVAVIDFAKGRVTGRRDVLRGDAWQTEQTLWEKAVPALSDGKTHRVEFYRVDYQLALLVDGIEVGGKDFWSPEEYRRLKDLALAVRLEGHTRSGVSLGARSAKLEITGLRIDRDVYYTFYKQRTSDGNQWAEWTIPKGCYFALGDNSPESWDSRYWKLDRPRFESWVPADHLIGKALLVWWSPLRVRMIH